MNEIDTGPAILAFVGLALGVVVLGLVIGLFTRVLRPLLEIRRYSLHILDAGLAITRNLDGVDELERTRELSVAVPRRGGAYLDEVGRGAL